MAPETTKVQIIFVVTAKFNTGTTLVPAVVQKFTAVTRMSVAPAKSTARKKDLVAVITEFITMCCQCAARVEFSTNGVDHPVVDRATITVKRSSAATVELFRWCTVPPAAVQRLIVRAFKFVVITRYILVEVVSDVVAAIAIKQTRTFVAPDEFYPGVVVHLVVVP